jgi:general secretion pathway protein J
MKTLRRTSRGFTLIELLVACALMAVLALLSWRGLESILQTRERLVLASDELRSLTLAFSQMDEDLLKSWPVNLLKLNESQLRVAVSGDDNAQSLHLIREVNRSGFATRVQRVVYEVHDRQLSRGFSQFGPAELSGQGGGALGVNGNGVNGNGGNAVGGGAVQSMVWQPILGGVRSITIRGWVEGRGWLDAASLAGVAQAAASANAASGGAGLGPPNIGAQAAQAAARALESQFTVTGIEIVLERVDGQRFLRVFSVKD